MKKNIKRCYVNDYLKTIFIGSSCVWAELTDRDVDYIASTLSFQIWILRRQWKMFVSDFINLILKK